MSSHLSEKFDIRPRRDRNVVWLLFILASLCIVAPLASVSTARAVSLPAGFSATVLANGLERPTAMAIAPDGRIFICHQNGRVSVVKQGGLLNQPFLTLNVDQSGERGLLGIAFDPGFATNRHVYLYYTATSPVVRNRVSRFTANGDVAAAGSEKVILELQPLSSSTRHNGGAIRFGNDGKLYIAVGDNANGANSQSLGNLFGKLLRINKNGTIPSSNPFYTTATGKNRAIWALGLRNPFSFDVQRGTGRIFINDPGENSWEEINNGIAGSNYGWPNTEGPTNDLRYRGPIFSYPNGSGATAGCAITGGAFYNPQTAQFPAAFVGDYLFTDLCSGWIRRFDPATGQVLSFATEIVNPVALAVGKGGAMFYLARGAGANSGSLVRITYAGS